MDKKIVLVTGGTKGIGRACSLMFAKENYFVLINYSKDENAAKALEQEIKSFGGECALLKTDISNLKHVDYMFRSIEDDYGRLDILVNNAGYLKDTSIFNLQPLLDLDKSLDINIKGTIACIHYASKIMFTQKSGSIINISSISSILGNPGQTIYSATKSAINAITLTTAKELAPFGIRVNAVLPGYIKTDMMSHIPEVKYKKIESLIPIGHFGMPEDVASAIKFLASEDSKYITGALLTVDGGLSI